MAKVKIILEKGETQDDAEELLMKAFEHHSSGDAHDSESFDDPAMNDVLHRMEKTHKQIYSEMLEEITEALEKQYSK